MKLLAHLKLSIKTILKELPSFVLAYGLLPLTLALLVGFIKQDAFQPQVTTPLFSVAIVNEDSSPHSRDLINFLNGEEMATIFTVVGEDSDFEYLIRIGQDYEGSLKGEKEATVRVEAQKKARTSLGMALVEILDSYHLAVGQGLVIQDNLLEMELSGTNTQDLTSEFTKVLTEAGSNKSVRHKIYELERKFTSHEYYSIAFLTFVFIMLLQAVLTEVLPEGQRGLADRIGSLPLTKVQSFNYTFASMWLQVFIISLIYVFAYRFAGLSFQGSLPLLLLITMVQALMITSLGYFLANVSKKFARFLLNIFLMLHMVVRVMIGSAYEHSSSWIVQTLGKFKLDYFISNSYHNYLLYNTLSSLGVYLLGMIAVTFLGYLGTLTLIKMNWGENK